MPKKFLVKQFVRKCFHALTYNIKWFNKTICEKIVQYNISQTNIHKNVFNTWSKLGAEQMDKCKTFEQFQLVKPLAGAAAVKRGISN